MKIVLIVYNRAIDEEVMEVLEEIGIESYTKWDRVLGRGRASGPHLDSDIWPGVNYMITIACQDEMKDRIITRVVKLKENLAKEGIKAFVLPLEEMV